MPESNEIIVNLSNGYSLRASDARLEPGDEVICNLILANGHKVFEQRATISTPLGRREWAEQATGDGRPNAHELADVIATELLEKVFAALQDRPKPQSQADRLVLIVQKRRGHHTEADDRSRDGTTPVPPIELWHDPKGEANATFTVGDHRETWALRSRTFHRSLARLYFAQYGKAPKAQALAEAVAVLEGVAVFEGPEHTVHLRIARHGDTVYLDLCSAAWEVVAITAQGWEITSDPPVRFRRTRGMLALPYPEEGGTIELLRPFVNVADDADWMLLVAWLVGSLRPEGPYPLLALHGEQGSAKSTTNRALRSLIDPNIAAIRTMPRDERDLMIAGTNGWCLAFDNLSHLQARVSDALCRVATGGGFATRELYTDQDETILDVQRPILLNGIEEVATRGDLLDRSIILTLPRIPEECRQTESAFWQDFEAARPKILGTLLDAVSMALERFASTRLDLLPRMADFAQWVTAAEPALGWEPGALKRAYEANRAAANDLTLEA